MSPWQAVDDAWKLSAQLGSWQERGERTQVPLPRTRKRLSTIDQTSHLSFDECVEIAFFPENDDPDFLQPFTLSSLESWSHKEGKPWSKKRCKNGNREQSQCLWPFSQFRLSDAWHNPLPEGFQEQGDPDLEVDPDIISRSSWCPTVCS